MILLISRKYPPSIGGMERVSYRLTTAVSRRREARIIAWGGSQTYLPCFVVIAFFRALALGLVHRVELIHVGDSALGLLGYVLGRILRVPVVVTVHGLDVTYPHWLYQMVTSRVLRTFDAVVAVSRAAHEECLKRGVRPDRCFVVTNGVDPPGIEPPERADARSRLNAISALNLADRDVLLTTGRLVTRKGVAWFVDDVLPRVVAQRPDTVYLIVGVGPEKDRILAAIDRRGMAGHARLLGAVPNEALWDAYRACDVFLMPNIAVKGDIEGFGLVALEACMAERCVAASDLEGIRDAIHDGKNGVLVRPGDPSAFADTIVRLLDDETERDALGRRARTFVAERFGWPAIVDRYLEIFDLTVTSWRHG